MTRLLNEVVARAKKSPFYKGKLSSGRFEDQPLTTKADLRAGYPFGFLAVERKRIATYHESSGTEGSPIASYFTERDWKDIASRFRRSAIGLKGDDTFLIKTPYAMVTTAHQAQTAARSVGATVVPADNRSFNMPYSRVVQLLSDVEVTVTWSLPTELLYWKIAADANGYDLTDFTKLRAFWVAGEPMSPSKRQAMSALWGGKPIFEDYGSTETGSLAGECSAGRLHFWSDRIHAEVLDPRTQTLSLFGKGRLVVTPLLREAMPLLRYLLDDEVELSQAGCSCGSPYSLIKVLGRGSQAYVVEGKPLTPLEVEDAVYAAGFEFELVLWRAVATPNVLKVEYYALGEGDLPSFELEVSRRLGVPVKARRRPLSEFLVPALLTEKLRFSKPKFLYRESEKPPRAVHYSQEAV